MKHKIAYILTTSAFPSPIGVLYISMLLRALCKQNRISGFRPLLGFFIFQLLQGRNATKKARLVSVPYWGSLYFNEGIYCNSNKSTIEVSVPYWGSLYFNEKMRLLSVRLVAGFRPLLGFFIFQSVKNAN